MQIDLWKQEKKIFNRLIVRVRAFIYLRGFSLVCLRCIFDTKAIKPTAGKNNRRRYGKKKEEEAS